MKRAQRFFWGLMLTIPGSILAQEPKKPAQNPPTPPAAPSVHSEVKLFLKNGDRVKGIVRNNRFCEKVQERDFLPAKAGEKGSGIRLYFVDGTKSYVFFPQEIYDRYEKLRGLTEVEFRDIAAKIEAANAPKKEAPPEEKKPAEAPKKEGEKTPEKPALTPEQQQELAKKLAEEEEGKALLEKFPPEAGWGESKLGSIRERRNNHLYPSKEEAEFEQNFDKWKKAFEAYQAKMEEELRKKAEKKPESSSAPN